MYLEYPERLADIHVTNPAKSVMVGRWAFTLVAIYYAGPLLWSLVPQSKNPFPEFEAEKFVAEYAKDAAAANEKFADKVIVIHGKLKVVRAGKRGRNEPAAHVYFEVPESDKLSVECVFDDMDIAFDLKQDAEYRIVGRVQRYKPGTPIVLKQAAVKAGEKTAELAQAAPALAADFCGFHQFLARRSSSLYIAQLQSHSPIARAIGPVWVGGRFPSRSYV